MTVGVGVGSDLKRKKWNGRVGSREMSTVEVCKRGSFKVTCEYSFSALALRVEIVETAVLKLCALHVYSPYRNAVNISCLLEARIG